MSRFVPKHGLGRLAAGGAMVAVLAIGGLASPASAKSSGWESILGGHLKTQSAAQKLATQAKAKGFKVHVQKISSGNYEAEIFNGGSKSQAAAVCAKARKAGLPHCSIEQEMHGNGWG